MLSRGDGVITGPALDLFDKLRAANVTSFTALHDQLTTKIFTARWDDMNELLTFEGRAYMPPDSALLLKVLVFALLLQVSCACSLQLIHFSTVELFGSISLIAS